MTIIELNELKKIELDILLEIDRICTKYNIHYQICGGTLLGAIRHRGFIPWDDDIDVNMPRPDYERFLELFKQESSFIEILSLKNDSKYWDLYAKAFHPKTLIVEEASSREPNQTGVYVDIFPVDGLGISKKKAMRQYRKTRFQRELLTASFWSKFKISKTHSWVYEPFRFLFFLLSRFVNAKRIATKIERREESVSFFDANYCACICGSYREKEIMPKEVFTDSVKIVFEGHLFWATRHYDYYLKQFYGDYMKLPPIDKRQSNHSFVAYWKE